MHVVPPRPTFSGTFSLTSPLAAFHRRSRSRFMSSADTWSNFLTASSRLSRTLRQLRRRPGHRLADFDAPVHESAVRLLHIGIETTPCSTFSFADQPICNKKRCACRRAGGWNRFGRNVCHRILGERLNFCNVVDSSPRSSIYRFVNDVAH